MAPPGDDERDDSPDSKREGESRDPAAGLDEGDRLAPEDDPEPTGLNERPPRADRSTGGRYSARESDGSSGTSPAHTPEEGWDLRPSDPVQAAFGGEVDLYEIADWEEAREYRVSRRPELKPEPDEYVGDIATIEEKRFRLVRRACEEYEPEFLFVLVSGPDWLFHYLGQRGDPSQIPELFGEFERYLDWFRENSRNLMLMSDHGFERKRTAVYPNKILQRAGLLTPEAGDQDAMQVLANVIKGLTKRSDLFYEVVRRTYHLLIHTEFSDDLYEAAKLAVEYGETAVWHHRDELVYVNDDRFDEPRVTDDEYATVRDRAIGALAGATDPETGRDLFADVSAGEAVYDGDAGIVPDVVAEPNEGVIAYRTPMQDDVAAPTDTYDHRKEGILYCVGDAFTDAGATADVADIADIAPTVLHLLGRPVPRDMDGSVIEPVLAEPGEIETGDPIEPGTVGARGAAEEAELTERLADLGYLE